jgi:hypothetical protein
VRWVQVLDHNKGHAGCPKGARLHETKDEYGTNVSQRLADQKETRRLPLLGIGVADADQAFSKTAARRFPRGFVTASDWNCPCTEIR